MGGVPEVIARYMPLPTDGEPADAGNGPVTIFDLGIVADQAAEAIPPQSPDVCIQRGGAHAPPSGAQRITRPPRVFGVPPRGAMDSPRCHPAGPGMPRVREGTSLPASSVDNPGLRSRVNSGHCQQGSRIVSAAFAGLRVRLAFIFVADIYTFTGHSPDVLTMVV